MQKRIVSLVLCSGLLLSLCMCGFTVLAQSDIAPTVYDLKDRFVGDLNGDNSVASGDIVLLRKALFGFKNDNSVPYCDDLNGDGKTDILDLVSIKKYIADSLDTVYLSSSGNDNNSGTQNAPVKTLNKAIDKAACGGNVVVLGSFSLSSSDGWGTRQKQVTVSGGTLDMSSMSVVRVKNAVEFNNITLKFANNATLYACGYPVEIGENATVNGTITAYGGDTSTVYKTNLKLLSGNYNKVYGGGNSAEVTTATNLYVGGSVNSGISDITNHSKANHMYGGSNGAACGETNFIFTDNASASIIYGGGSGANSFADRAHLTVSGGKMMGIYGGSNSGSCGETTVDFLDGDVEQVFGANEGPSMTGNTNVNILGGRVRRRIFGGCYNEVARSGLSVVWHSEHHVKGNTTVTIGENPNISLDYNSDSYDDLGISATSRYKTAFSDEYATIIFTNSAAESKYKSKLGIKVDDFLASIFLTFASPYDACKVLK